MSPATSLGNSMRQMATIERDRSGAVMSIDGARARPPVARRSRSALGRLILPDPLRELLLFGAQLGRELVAEVRGFEERAQFQHGFLAGRVRAALRPLERFLHRLHLPDPEPGDQLLGLGERTVHDRALLPRELDPRARRAGLEPVAREHDARLHQLLVVARHLAEHLLARHDPRLGILARLHDHHDPHRLLLVLVVRGAGRLAGSPAWPSPLLSSRRTMRPGIDTGLAWNYLGTNPISANALPSGSRNSLSLSSPFSLRCTTVAAPRKRTPRCSRPAPNASMSGASM